MRTVRLPSAFLVKVASLSVSAPLKSAVTGIFSPSASRCNVVSEHEVLADLILEISALGQSGPGCKFGGRESLGRPVVAELPGNVAFKLASRWTEVTHADREYP